MPTPPAVIPRALTADAFWPFGEVVAANGAGRLVNRGEAVRHDHIAALTNLREAAAANLALFEVKQGSQPLSVAWLERHCHSTQLFLPLTTGRYIAVVAPPSSSEAGPDVASATAFLASGEAGLTYRPGTWHHGLIPLDGPMRFAMLVWEDGSAGDVEIVDLPAPLVLDCAGLA